jgi:hypothetical protein
MLKTESQSSMELELKDDFLDPYELESVSSIFYELSRDERPLQIGPGDDGDGGGGQ